VFGFWIQSFGVFICGDLVPKAAIEAMDIESDKERDDVGDDGLVLDDATGQFVAPQMHSMPKKISHTLARVTHRNVSLPQVDNSDLEAYVPKRKDAREKLTPLQIALVHFHAKDSGNYASFCVISLLYWCIILATNSRSK